MRDASWAELAPRLSTRPGCWVPNSSLQGPQRWHRKKDARKESSCRRKTQADRQRSILSAGAGVGARMRMRGALAPHPPAGRPFTLATAARQRRARGLGADGRDLCGTGRDGTARTAAEVAGR